MIPNEANERVDQRRPTSEELKEVYAHFGRAYYYAEVLHRGLCNLAALSQFPKAGPITGPRVEELLSGAFESTLGQVIRRLTGVLSQDLILRLNEAAKIRNFLAHHFWYDRVHLMATVAGSERMIAELSEASELFHKLDSEIKEIILPLYFDAGMTQADLNEHLQAVSSGEDPGPLLYQRKPRREEMIVRIYDVPSQTPGTSVLVFETDDGAFWQLCDVGLGWTGFEHADACWRHAEKFTEYLPARTNPRPSTQSEPWHYDLQLGTLAVLEVRRGKMAGQILYKLRRLREDR